ncbi:MAG TPA: hypothetical protein DDZ70_09665, partial [Firmicutes bacterium]|nr:hypothetical protein [Bacillota bacterium]
GNAESAASAGNGMGAAFPRPPTLHHRLETDQKKNGKRLVLYLNNPKDGIIINSWPRRERLPRQSLNSIGFWRSCGDFSLSITWKSPTGEKSETLP